MVILKADTARRHERLRRGQPGRDCTWAGFASDLAKETSSLQFQLLSDLATRNLHVLMKWSLPIVVPKEETSQASSPFSVRPLLPLNEPENAKTRQTMNKDEC